MKIVILGAGASYDCFNRFHDSEYNPGIEYSKNEELKWRPPLGNDLFGSRGEFREIRKGYSYADRISSSASSGNNIEEFFQNKWQLYCDTEDLDIGCQLLHSQYYLQELFYEISKNYKNQGVSNYSILLDLAHEYTLRTNEDVVFITFNYDTLLDELLLLLYGEENIKSADFYIAHKIKIIKPHGSCNWIKRFYLPWGISGAKYKKQIMDLVSSKEVNLSNLDELFPNNIETTINPNSKGFRFLGHFKNEDYHLLPQLLIPLKTKDEFILPDEHKNVMEDALSKATEILVIGWKGEEEYFLQTLKNTINERAINITGVVRVDETLKENLEKVIPNMNYSYFTLPYSEEDINNYGERVKKLEHPNGSFSSYILNITKISRNHFFKV